jgi:ceramide glucosyltransferase
MIEILLYALVIASWAFWIIAYLWVRAFFGQEPEESDYMPAVSILKPVKGLDVEAYENFASFCRQDYPRYELLFGVADADDPVIPVIQRLQEDFPEQAVRLTITPTRHMNRKASLLHALSAQAQHGVLVVNDSDMRVGPEYLRRVVAPLADKRVGLVSCLYRGCKPLTFTARLEALHMGVTFLPSVLVARRFLDMRFAMGATVALRRRDLVRIGGFAAVADYLADDFQLGVQISDLGLRVHLSRYIVDSILGPTTFREQWDRELRWIQCGRVSRPVEYPGMLLTFSTPVALILAVVSGFQPYALAALAGSLIVRWMTSWWVTAVTDNRALRKWLIWLPVRDLLSALVWAAGAVGRRVVWRGETYLLEPGGRLQPQASSTEGARIHLAAPMRDIVHAIDALLRHLYGIREFCHHPDCMFRLSTSQSEEDVTLADGTRIRRGERIGEIHLWNEFMPRMPEEGPDLAWARSFQRQLSFSLTRLAAHIQTNPQYRDIQAFRADNSFMGQYDLGPLERKVGRFGFEVVDDDGPSGLWERFGEFWENVYAWALVWAYNPGGLKGSGSWKLHRRHLWLSRATLLHKYGAAAAQDLDPEAGPSVAQGTGLTGYAGRQGR